MSLEKENENLKNNQGILKEKIKEKREKRERKNFLFFPWPSYFILRYQKLLSSKKGGLEVLPH
jgi:hypothetical protein